ncbi:iron-regulated protein A [Vibrio paracholerae]|uniref:imelysin family protein n=1 Tax=Vibrio paracholerae TaxID=650003 RepID=UPI002096045C|nr:imelysin family protein [Vibrio paracholerae]MCO7014394.1 iron-regulated protein A [Vibrio paracholerae]
MKKTVTLLAVSLLAACQSAPNMEHPSQAVFELERESAHILAEQTKQLQQRMAHYCQAPTTDISPLKQEWQASMQGWMALQGQQRGPSAALDLSWNMQFWPDKKDTTGHKMKQLLAKPPVWEVDDIAKQSVAVQGLGALEWLIFDSASPLLTAPQQACPAAMAISATVQLNATHIAKAWQENPWQSLDDRTWRAEYIALLSNQLEFTLSKLNRPLANIGQPRPYFSESWRSKTSLSNMRYNLLAIQALYLADGKGMDAMLRQQGMVATADRVTTQLAGIIETWPQQASLFDLLQTKAGYREGLVLRDKLEQLNYLLHDEVAVGLGVVIGFNATDGD